MTPVVGSRDGTGFVARDETSCATGTTESAACRRRWFTARPILSTVILGLVPRTHGSAGDELRNWSDTWQRREEIDPVRIGQVDAHLNRRTWCTLGPRDKREDDTCVWSGGVHLAGAS
jgi:hypothetical protein